MVLHTDPLSYFTIPGSTSLPAKWIIYGYKVGWTIFQVYGPAVMENSGLTGFSGLKFYLEIASLPN